MTREARVAVALDMGGSNIKAALIRADGEMLVLRRLPTPHELAPDAVVDRLVGLVSEMCAETGIAVGSVEGIGVSMAGFVTTDGVITATAHLSRAWIGYDLKARLRQSFDTRYYFALDSPAPALGEAYYGAGAGFPNFVYVTVSTGIGGGIFFNGRYMAGGLGWAGGFGHQIIDENSPRVCTGCGNHGCLETFAAFQGIVTTARELMADSPDSSLHVMARDAGEVTPRLVARAARDGDPAANEVWRRAGHVLGIGLTNVVNTVSPTRIVIGGGISQAGDLLLDPARAVIRERAFPPQHRGVEVVQAALGDLSGAYGAAAMVFHDLLVTPPEKGAAARA